MSAISVVCLWEVLIADQIIVMASNQEIENIYTLCGQLAGTFEDLRESWGFYHKDS